MGKPTLVAAIAAAVVALSIASTTGNVASSASQPGEEFVERVHGLEGLLLQPPESSLIPRPAPLDIESIARDRTVMEVSECWPLGTGAPEPAGQSTDEFKAMIESLDAGGELESIHLELNPILRLRCRATKPMHDRISWAIEALRQYSEARIDVEILELPSRPPKVVLSAAEVQALKGKSIWTSSLWQGQAGIASQLHESRVLFGIEHRPGGESRTAGTLYSGAQWRVTAASMPGGSVRMQAVFARGRDVEIRACELPEGSFELPAMTWTFMPSCGTVPNGGGLLLDGGDRWFVVRALAAKSLEHYERVGGYGIWNPVGAAPAQDQFARWLLPPADSTLGGQEYLGLPQRPDWAHDHRVQQGQGLGTFGRLYAEEVEQPMRASFRLASIGPMLLSADVAHDPQDPDARRMTEEKRDFHLELLRRFGDRPFGTSGVVAVVVPSRSKIPEGIIKGRPLAQDIQTLRGLPGALALVDRRVASELDQTVDLLEVRLRNHMASHHVYGHPTRGPQWEPDVRTAASGWQVRLFRGANQRMTARFALREILPLRVLPGTGDSKGRDMEAQEGPYTEGVIDVLATEPGWHSVIRPLDDKRQLVLLVEVIK
ncbi:MAG: hypothetical protein KF754_01395 [Planctomycetes bacterium]|nr:hypothetical protein [Planctomycetota bacterium]